MKNKIVFLVLICVFIFSPGCKKQLPTSPDITGMKFPAPYALDLTVISSSRIDLDWQNGTGYNTIEIYRNEANAGYRKYSVINGNKEHWEDISCMPEIEYCYKLKGRWMHGPVGVSGYSNEACVTSR